MNQLVGARPGGKPVMALFLDPGNIQRLRQGKPILIHVEDSFPNGMPKRLDLAILHSETPVADARELAQIADITFDERTPEMKKKRPHCPECMSTIETLGVWRGQSPIAITYCPVCGCQFGCIDADIVGGRLEVSDAVREQSAEANA